MNIKDLLGKKIIDKKARDVAKLADINVNTKTFTISNIYGSTGNPISKKYIVIPVGSILAVGDYIQISETLEELHETLLDKIPEPENKIIKANDLIGKTTLDSEGNVAGKVTNVELDIDTYKIEQLILSGSSSGFGKPKSNKTLKQDDITSIGDYIIINKVFVEEPEEKEEKEEKKEEDKESVKVDIE